MSNPNDADARQQALDPSHSFIVQAPAGSGKTELLTQRCLRLLACVDQPEEIIALTFTRKAAAEMRERIVSALQQAATNIEPESDNDRARMQLAAEALQRDADKHWQLRENPQRLRVMTIDAFNGSLVRQMPLVAQTGGVVNTTDQPRAHYREAARRTVEYIQLKTGGDPVFQDALNTLLRYFDNRADYVEQQLVAMLAQREQWLKPVGSTLNIDEAQLKRQLEAAWRVRVESRLQELHQRLPKSLARDLPPLAHFAAEQLRSKGKASPVLRLSDMRTLPDTSWESVSHWQAIAAMLLTAEGAVRKQVRVSEGFPADKEFAPQKQAMNALLKALLEHTGFAEQLSQCRNLPGHGYDDKRWELLSALRKVLLLAVAQLRVEFSTRGEIDHSENTLRALQVLGDDEAPTDLALSLDYRIGHLLVDEFQDTSVSQFELLEKLVRGWQPDDGRTLFLVGDPMQSIYRFRQAEVGLFLRARRDGVGDVSLNALNLTQNFRSSSTVVEWVNNTFIKVFSAAENIEGGAVAYTESAAHKQIEGAKVVVHPTGAWQQEAEQLVDTIEACKRENPQQRVAVLVRSRSHLALIHPLLRERGIAYQDVDIEKLGELPVIRDLLALTHALHHPGDDIAWLAVLRAPWCGLSLADLLALRGVGGLVSSAVLGDHDIAGMSADGEKRLLRMRAVMREAQLLAGRVPLQRLVKSTWLQLGGFACVEDDNSAVAATVFFEELAGAGNATKGFSIADFSERLGDCPAPLAESGDDTLQLMTIHKSKGLEFDTVIVPNLGRAGRNDDPPPIKWLQDVHGELLLAPVKRPDEKNPDAMYALLNDIEKEKAANELKRLLYVAVTRAKSQIHLFGHARVSDRGTSCDKRSLLNIIWPQVEAQFEAALAAEEVPADIEEETAEPVPAPPLRRLPEGWQAPPLPEGLSDSSAALVSGANEADAQGEVEFDWAGQSARIIGTVVHRYLQQIANDGVSRWSRERIDDIRGHIESALLEQGLDKADCDRAVARCQRALQNAVSDDRGRWLLGENSAARSEFALSGVVESSSGESRVERFVIDRTFVDEQGTRWIVDYKTGDHRGSDVDLFLDREQTRYQPQLENYAALFRHIEDKPIRLGLYFPMLKGWREWTAGPKN